MSNPLQDSNDLVQGCIYNDVCRNVAYQAGSVLGIIRKDNMFIPIHNQVRNLVERQAVNPIRSILPQELMNSIQISNT